MTAPFSMRGAVRRSGVSLEWPRRRAYRGADCAAVSPLGAVGATAQWRARRVAAARPDCAEPMKGAVRRVALTAGPRGSRSTFVTRVRQTPRERVQAIRRRRAAPPAPLTEAATVGTQTREWLQETFEATRMRSRRVLMPAVRAEIGLLIHRPENQPAPSSALNQAQQARERNGSGCRALRALLSMVVLPMLTSAGAWATGAAAPGCWLCRCSRGQPLEASWELLARALPVSTTMRSVRSATSTYGCL
jgi:hypothetical protein